MASKLTGNEAIEYAARNGLTLSKYEDPTEGARDGLTVAEAREVAREDAGLVYVVAEETDKAYGVTFSEWLGAAGRDDSASDYDLRAAWRAGEDPAEYARA